MSIWIFFTLMAALMQAVRTAGQKQLSAHLSAMATTLTRYLFGLPFVLIYLGMIFYQSKQTVHLNQVFNNETFLGFALAASVAQILATMFLVKVLSFNNFAVLVYFFIHNQ